MPDPHQSGELLPGILLALGAFFLVAGVLTDGPERTGGIVFGTLSLAAAGAIFHRRARDAKRSSNGDAGGAPSTILKAR
jgi:hypothetical protein